MFAAAVPYWTAVQRCALLDGEGGAGPGRLMSLPDDSSGVWGAEALASWPGEPGQVRLCAHVCNDCGVTRTE